MRFRARISSKENLAILQSVANLLEKCGGESCAVMIKYISVYMKL